MVDRLTAAWMSALLVSSQAHAQTGEDRPELELGHLDPSFGAGIFPSAEQRVRPPAREPGWRPILSVPRVGGRIWSLTVDPRDPRRIFVGTEAGSLLLSDDGGATWNEVDVDARVVQERSSTAQPPGLPRLGAQTPSNFGVVVDPPDRTAVDRITISSVANPFPIRPSFFWAGFFATARSPPVTLLDQLTRSRVWKTQPIRRIALCPGGPYEVIVASSDAVYGSQDGGLSFVRLFANAGRVFIDHALCSPADPRSIAVATNIGLFLSRDGGYTFDQDLTAWPGKKSTAIAYAVPRYEGEVFLFSASKSELFAGDPSQPEGLTAIYPNSAATAPWRSIRWITTDPDGGIYLATDDGARVSFDRGRTWKVVARTLTSRQAIAQMEVGESPSGQKRIALVINVRPRSMRGRPVTGLQNSIVYATDDRGQTFFPFFEGLSMRTFRQMSAVAGTVDHPAGWWIATSGGVWTTYPEPPRASLDVPAIEWAERRLARTPRLDEVLREVLTRAQLSNGALDRLGRRWRARGMVPKLELSVRGFERTRGSSRDRGGPVLPDGRQFVQGRNRGLERDYLFVLLQLTWRTDDLLRTAEDLGTLRRQIHRLRRQIELAAQDAYHERMTLLQDIVNGLPTDFEIRSVWARIEGLEAILSTWMRRPFPGSREPFPSP